MRAKLSNRWTWLGSMVACVLLLAGCVRAGFMASASDAGTDGPRLGPQPWRELGGSASGQGIASPLASAHNLRVAVGGGVVAVGWSDASNGNDEVYLKSWREGAWRDLDGSSAPGGLSQSRDPSYFGDVVVDGAGNPHVAWMEQGQGISYLKWTGSAWQPAIRSARGARVSSGNPWWPALALDSTATPTVAWEVYNIEDRGLIYLERLTAAGWQELSGSATGTGLSGVQPGSSQFVRVAVGSNGTIHVVWQQRMTADDDARSEIVYRAFDGVAWGAHQNVSDSGANGSRPYLAVDRQGRPLVIYIDGEYPDSRLHLRRLEGGRWVGVGGSDAGEGPAGATHGALSGEVVIDADGQPVIAWGVTDGTSAGDVHALRFNGAQWRGLVEPEVTAVTSSGRASWPHLAADETGLYLAWEERVGATVAVYVLHQAR